MSRIYLPILCRLGSTGTFYLVTGQITGVILGFSATVFSDLWSAWKSAETAVRTSNLITDNFLQDFLS